VGAPVEPPEPSCPWGGRQPRYETLLYRGPGRFFAQTQLPSGRRIAVRLAGGAGQRFICRDRIVVEPPPERP
jgi:hypothetical protein